MAESSKTIGLNILEREYRVNCPAGAEDELREAGRYLHEKMSEIKQASSNAGKVLGTDRIAVIAALNIAHQLLSAEGEYSGAEKDISRLCDRIDLLLNQESQLEL